MPPPNRASRTTPNLALRVPADAELADLVTVVGDFADKVDAVVPQAATSAGASAGAAAAAGPRDEALAARDAAVAARNTATSAAASATASAAAASSAALVNVVVFGL